MMHFWCLSVTYIGPKSRTESRKRPRKTKIGTEVAHVTCDPDTAFKVKRSTCRGGRGHIVAASHTACYLCQEWHVLPNNYLSVCQYVSSFTQKNYWLDLHENSTTSNINYQTSSRSGYQSSMLWRNFYHCGIGEIWHILQITHQEVVDKFLWIYFEKRPSPWQQIVLFWCWSGSQSGFRNFLNRIWPL